MRAVTDGHPPAGCERGEQRRGVRRAPAGGQVIADGGRVLAPVGLDEVVVPARDVTEGTHLGGTDGVEGRVGRAKGACASLVGVGEERRPQGCGRAGAASGHPAPAPHDRIARVGIGERSHVGHLAEQSVECELAPLGHAARTTAAWYAGNGQTDETPPPPAPCRPPPVAHDGPRCHSRSTLSVRPPLRAQTRCHRRSSPPVGFPGRRRPIRSDRGPTGSSRPTPRRRSPPPWSDRRGPSGRRSAASACSAAVPLAASQSPSWCSRPWPRRRRRSGDRRRSVRRRRRWGPRRPAPTWSGAKLSVFSMSRAASPLPGGPADGSGPPSTATALTVPDSAVALLELLDVAGRKTLKLVEGDGLSCPGPPLAEQAREAVEAHDGRLGDPPVASAAAHAPVGAPADSATACGLCPPRVDSTRGPPASRTVHGGCADESGRAWRHTGPRCSGRERRECPPPARRAPMVPWCRCR